MGNNLRKCRMERGKTVEEIAEKVEVSQSTYYKWEDGTRSPSIKKGIIIAKILGSTVEELFFDNLLDETSNKETA